MDKKLIEKSDVDLLELFDDVSKEAIREKVLSLVPPINKILYWWTRKPLIVGRAIALLSIMPYEYDTSKVKGYLNLNKEKRAYKYNINTNNLIPIPNVKVLDPFAGAGNLIFEASRLGFECYSLDYNPVAYLIQKAVLEYPRIYSNLKDDVKMYGEKVIEMTRQELKDLYYYDSNRRRVLAYLYVWCIRCPRCNQRIPLMNHSYLANTNKKKIGIRVKPNNNNNSFSVEIINNISKEEGEFFTQKRGKAKCIACKNSIEYDELTGDIAKNKDFELIALVVEGKNGKDYELPNANDREAIRKARELLINKFEELKNEDLIPIEERTLEEERKNLLKYGIKYWYQHFNPRQLLLMVTLLKNIRVVSKEIESIKGKDYAKVIATYLVFMLCKHIDFNSIGIGWVTARETIGHTLAMRSPRIIYNFAETNPFEETNGSLYSVLDYIIEAIEFVGNNSNNNNNIPKIILGSALHLPYANNYFDLIITDPPYLDDVAYGELSEFFYVWLYRALKDYYPELPARVPLDEDIVLSKNRFNSKKLAMEFYIKALKGAFKEINRVLKDDGLAVVFFAHSSLEAWNILLDTLRESRFQVISSYAVHTESESNVLARGKTSFMSSIVIACRKIVEDKDAYIEDLIPEIENRIDSLLKNIDRDRLLRLPITDLLIMIYGKVLEATTSYSRLKSYSKEQPDFESILNYAREYMMRVIVRKLIDRDVNTIGSEIAFYLVGRVFFNGMILADDALHIMRTYNLDDNRLKRIATKEEGSIRLKPFKEVSVQQVDNIDPNNIHQQLMFIEHITANKKEGAARIRSYISNYPHKFRVDDIKSIVSLLLKSYDAKRNKGIKLSSDEDEEYNILKAVDDVLNTDSSPSKGNMDYWINK
jgi:putative DNA methylase